MHYVVVVGGRMCGPQWVNCSYKTSKA